MDKKVVLIVDDEVLLLDALAEYLALQPDMEPLKAGDGLEALRMLDAHPVDVVLTDVKMPRMGGFELLDALREVYPDMPVIMMTAYYDFEDHEKLSRLGVCEFLRKPFSFSTLENAIRNALAK